MSHSIGDVSRVLGMTTSALHYYEKEGIISPPKVESGRRYYEEADVYRLISAKKYRAMGVSLREIAAQFGGEMMDAGQIVDRMRERQQEAARLARSYALLEEDIRRLVQMAEGVHQSNGCVDIRPVGEMLILSAENGGFVPQDKEEQEIVKQWLEAMPAVSAGVYRRKGESRAAMALMIPADRAQDYGFAEDGRMIHRVRGGMALHAVVSCGEELNDQPEVIFRQLDAFAREHRFTQADTAYGCTLLVDCSDGGKTYHYDVNMLFE